MGNKQKAGISAAIALILAAVFAVEGGYVNDPRDPGGETNHGVTKQVAAQNGYSGPMRDLTRAQAQDIYTRQYIEAPGFLPVVERDAHVGHEAVDSGVNAGPLRAGRWLQESLNLLNGGGRDYPDIAEDGRVGPATVRALEALQRRRGRQLACELTVKLMDAKQAQHYASLAARDATFEAFMVGWVRTRIGNVDWRNCGGEAH